MLANGKLWENNKIQFPRLLAELRASGITNKQYEDVADSMDCSVEEVEELFERAELEFQKIKERIL